MGKFFAPLFLYMYHAFLLLMVIHQSQNQLSPQFYLCLDLVKNLDDTAVIFTDCDNSLDWWDEETIQNWLTQMKNSGYDFFGPRTNLKLKNFIEGYNRVKDVNPRDGVFWHKLFNFDFSLSSFSPLSS